MFDHQLLSQVMQHLEEIQNHSKTHQSTPELTPESKQLVTKMESDATQAITLLHDYIETIPTEYSR